MYWAGASVLLVLIFGTIYGAGQFILRANADDPQIQLAEDTARQLDEGQTPAIVTAPPVDFEESLAPFVVVYNKQGQPIQGNGQLDSALPAFPVGVFTHAQPQTKVSWQPKPTVRVAAVVQANNGGYVVAGRSLLVVEQRENRLLAFCFVTGLLSEITLTGMFLYHYGGLLSYAKKSKKK